MILDLKVLKLGFIFKDDVITFKNAHTNFG